MKFNFLVPLATFSCLFMMMSCSSDENNLSNGTGKIKTVIKPNFSVSMASKIDRSNDVEVITPSVEEFSLHLAKIDGSYDKTWDSPTDFPEDYQFPIGTYTMEASYGDADVEGFENPYYYGSTRIVVYDGETSDATIEATLGSTMVSMEYTNAFKNYFTNYSTTLHSAGGGNIEFVKDETRPAYLKPGDISMNMSLTKTNGTTLDFVPTEIKNALPQTHYHITFDVNSGNVGDAQLVITFNEETETEPIIIDLSDELISAPNPTIVTTGYNSTTPINIIAGDEAPHDLKALITAQSGLKEVNLTVNSASLLAAGVPAEINLLNATSTQKELLTNLGLKTKGLWGNVDKMAQVDFTGLIKHLAVVDGKSTHVLTLQVIDKYTKVNEDPVVLTVEAPALQFSLAEPTGRIDIGQTSVKADVTYNGTDFNNKVKIYSNDAYGAWKVCPITNVVDNGTHHTVTFTVHDASQASRVKAVYNGTRETNVITFLRNSVSVLSENVWAKSAYITVNPQDVDCQALVESADVYIKTTGDYIKVAPISRDYSTRLIGIGSLTPNTAYTVKLVLPATTSNEVSFTTESSIGVPNGNFETLAQTINRSINQGGKYSITLISSMRQNTTTYDINEPTGWASVNAKTASESADPQNTWFAVPSTYSTPEAQNGSYAMVIQNAGWDLSGTLPGDDKATKGIGSYYSNKTPGTIANSAAGKLFLGSYAFSATNSTETYNEGVAFSSRPANLIGHYKYTRDGNDGSETGVVTVTLLNGSTVIGTGTQNLEPASNYTEFNVPITYSNKHKKATSLRIMITSSNHASTSIAQENSTVKVTKHTKFQQQATGASLVVDNLTFAY